MSIFGFTGIDGSAIWISSSEHSIVRPRGGGDGVVAFEASLSRSCGETGGKDPCGFSDTKGCIASKVGNADFLCFTSLSRGATDCGATATTVTAVEAFLLRFRGIELFLLPFSFGLFRKAAIFFVG